MQIKEQVFAQRSKPEIGAALDAEPPEDEDKEIRAAMKKNLAFGTDANIL